MLIFWRNIDIATVFLVIVFCGTLCADVLVSSEFVHGVGDAAPILSDAGECLFIAPMPERQDSVEHNFMGVFLAGNGKCQEIFSGFSRNIAEMMGIYSMTACHHIAANADFSRFAIVYESILTGFTPPDADYTIPYTTAVNLAVLQRNGAVLWKQRLTATVSPVASQCRLLFIGNNVLAYGPQLGCRLYSNDGASFENLPLGNVHGSIAYASEINTLFYANKDKEGNINILTFDLGTRDSHQSGLSVFSSISDLLVNVSSEGRTLLFRSALNEICIAEYVADAWQRKFEQAKLAGGLSLSSTGGFALWKSGSDLILYDIMTGVKQTISEAEGISLSVIAPEGYNVAYLNKEANGRLMLWSVENVGNNCKLAIRKGWELYGFSFALDENSQAALKGVGEIYVWENGKYVLLDRDLQVGEGFWMRSDAEKGLFLKGHLLKAKVLSQGWHLVNPLAYEDLLGQAKLFSLEGDARCYISAPNNMLKQGAGNWIFINAMFPVWGGK